MARILTKLLSINWVALSVLLLSGLIYACSSDKPVETFESSETVSFICKAQSIAEGDSTYSVFALIGNNQTKIVDSKICQTVKDPSSLTNPTLRKAKTVVKISDSPEYLFISTSIDGYHIKSIAGDVIQNIAVFKDGKFFFE